MEFKIYNNGLPADAMEIRTVVFVEEQGFVDMPDETDKTAAHILGYDGDKAVAVCRVFRDGESDVYILGRFAVIKEYRGRGIGRELLREAETYVASVGGKRLMLHSQYHARGFYESCGYAVKGVVEYEQGEPHIWLEREVEIGGKS